MKYESVFTVKVPGQPDVHQPMSFPDEATFLAAVEAYGKARQAGIDYRRAHPHEEATKKSKGPPLTVSLSIKATIDGRPHMDESGTIHDLPAEALPAAQAILSQFLSNPIVAKCLSH